VKFGELIGEEIEVKCRSARCGAKPGVVVLHRFNTATGEVAATNRYRTIAVRKE
jgi:hypothetical protein